MCFYVVHCISKYFSRQHVRAAPLSDEIENKSEVEMKSKKNYSIYTQNGDGKIARKAISQSA